MLYVEYAEISAKYNAAQRAYNALIDEKETLFSMTQPGAIRYDKDRVAGGSGKNLFDEYVIAKERSRIDERLQEQKAILDERRTLKEIKEQELRRSKHLHDRMYVYRYLDRLTLLQIENRIPYSRVQIWRILKIIEKNCSFYES